MLGVVTDKEKGLVPAVERVFPEVPYQLCHTHFLKNCAKPLQADLTSLQASIRRRADAARKLSKQLSPPSKAAPEASASEARVVVPAVDETQALTIDETQPPAQSTEVLAVAPPAKRETPVPAGALASLSEEALARELCELVRVNSRVSGKAPLDPAELKRHERIESIRALLDDARKKKPRSAKGTPPGPCSTR